MIDTATDPCSPRLHKEIACDVENCGMKINKELIVDFGKEPNGPRRRQKTRYLGEDCTSDIWL